MVVAVTSPPSMPIFHTFAAIAAIAAITSPHPHSDDSRRSPFSFNPAQSARVREMQTVDCVCHPAIAVAVALAAVMRTTFLSLALALFFASVGVQFSRDHRAHRKYISTQKPRSLLHGCVIHCTSHK